MRIKERSLLLLLLLIPESRSDYNYKRSMITFTKMWQGFTLPKKKTNIYSIIKSSIQLTKCTLVQ